MPANEIRRWSPEEDERLRMLWLQGYRTKKIGELLDRSKNMVIGRAHRLGLEPRPSPIRRVV